MEVRIDELRQITNVLLNHLEKRHGKLVVLEEDYYWNIPEKQRTNPYESPDELDLGQLTDDWDNLKRILSGEGEQLGYALVWLSAVMRAVGEKAVS